MKNYQECSQEQFNAAMAKMDADLSTITNQELYILKTKFEAEANNNRGESSYCRMLRYGSAQRYKKYATEMRDRMHGKRPDVW